MEDEVIIEEYNDSWPEYFQKEKTKILQYLEQAVIIDIQHFGSTSIPGLAAKPIIDILVGFERFSVADKNIRSLNELNYQYVESVSLPGERLFLKKTPRSHHVHFVEYGTEHWSKPLIFRDYLKENEEERNLYEKLKRELAIKYRNDRIGYMNAKTSFIKERVGKNNGD